MRFWKLCVDNDDDDDGITSKCRPLPAADTPFGLYPFELPWLPLRLSEFTVQILYMHTQRFMMTSAFFAGLCLRLKGRECGGKFIREKERGKKYTPI